MSSEAKAREEIDKALSAAGWSVQDLKQVNLRAARGVAIREFPLVSGHGDADYLLYVDGKAAGVIEAKKVGSTLTGVEIQSAKYSEGLPGTLPAYIRPLPFLYESTGVETHFTSGLDPEPKSRQVFNFHRPETLADWISAAGLRHGNRRLQKGQVTDARASAVSFDLIGVDLKKFLQTQKDRFHRSVCQASESPAIAFVNPRQGGTKRFYAFGITDGRDNQAFAIGDHGERSVGINFQEIQHAPINNEGQAIPVLG